MRHLVVASLLLVACGDDSGSGGGGGGSGGSMGSSGPSVLQHHGDAARTGLYIAPNLTRAAAAGIAVDSSFNAPVMGPTYAQVLYVADSQRDLVIAATEQNQVSAFDANGGAVVWQRVLVPPRPRAQMQCGNIDPVGITGTPYIDLPSRTVFLDAMTTDNNVAAHKVFGLSLDDGSTRAGWPVDGNTKFKMGTTPTLDSGVQNERGALAFLNGVVYVPYGGFAGDCGNYHGWVVGIPIANPGQPTAWHTTDFSSGIWAPSGASSDGTSLFVGTGNGGETMWGNSEMLGRLGPGPTFSGNPTDYWVPADWHSLDLQDADLGGTGPLVIDVPGATPSQLVVAMGKDGNIYLVNRANMGGIGAPVATLKASSSPIINAAAAFRAPSGSYLVFRGTGVGCPTGQFGSLVGVKIDAASPPTMKVVWCQNFNGRGSPMVTTTDGMAESIVWAIGSEGDNALHGYNAETGVPIVTTPTIGPVARFVTPIYAKGRIFVGANAGVFAFK